MENDRQRRVLVAVSPVVVQGALSALLRAAGFGDVLEFDDALAAAAGSPFDVALVTGGLPRAVRSTVVIILPDTESGTGRAIVITPLGTAEVDVQTHQQVLELLDQQLPGATPLARWVSAASAVHLVAQQDEGITGAHGGAVA